MTDDRRAQVKPDRRASPIACRSRSAHSRLRRQSRPKIDPLASVRASPRRRPSALSFSTPKRPSMQRSGCALALTNSAKATNWTKPGLFYDPAALGAAELEVLKRFASDNGIKLRTVSEFVDEVLYDRAYDLRASIVGFNLPFDISRLAIRHGSARGKAMRGGFTFKLLAISVAAGNSSPPSQCAGVADPIHPSAEAAQSSRATETKDCAPRTARIVHRFEDDRGGFAQPIIQSRVARRLPEDADPQSRKRRTWEAVDSRNILRYAVQDVQATWECYQALRDRYALHALEETPIGKILSEASLGKAYLKQMGVRPFSRGSARFSALISPGKS